MLSSMNSLSQNDFASHSWKDLIIIGLVPGYDGAGGSERPGENMEGFMSCIVKGVSGVRPPPGRREHVQGDQ